MGFALTWQSVGGIILMLLVVIALHEFGHFVVAKRAGIQVDEFSIGFGPRLASRKSGETRYSLRLLPLGGYVRMAGMTGLEAPEASGGERGFIRASAGRRAAVIAAGGLTNLVLAGAIFAGIAAVGGPAPQIQAGGALATEHVPQASRIVAVSGQNASSLNAVRNLIEAAKGNPVAVTMEPWAGGQRQTYQVTPQLRWIGTQSSIKIPFEAKIVALDGVALPHATPEEMAAALPGSGPVAVTYLNGSSTGTVSVSRSQLATDWQVGYLASAGNPLLPSLGGPPRPWYQALGVGFWTVPTQIGTTFVNLWTLITPHHNPNLQLTGPVGIAQETSIAAEISPTVYLTLLALISLNLGLFNLLPIPFLDGGKLFFVGLEVVRRRKANPKLEAAVHTVGLALIVMLFIYVTFGDIARLTR